MERFTEREPIWIDDEMWVNACEPDIEEIDAVYHKLKDFEDLEELIGIPLKELTEIFQQHIPSDCKHPKKVIVLTDGDADKWREYRQLEETRSPLDDGAFGICPRCYAEFNSELVNEYNINYCLNCGQKLDWSGKE